MGVIAFCLDILVEKLMELRWEVSQHILSWDTGLGFLTLIMFSLFYVAIAALLVVYIAPAALGSGVAEAMGILNGV